MRVTITQNIKEYNLKASQNIKFFRVIINRLGKRGLNGKSAYEVAVANGFVGTEPEWLLSLMGDNLVVGVDGKDGKDGIDGKDGKDAFDGVDGLDGESAYEVAVANGFVGTEPEWLLTLIGADGKNGIIGTNGIDGKNGIIGTNGKDGVDGKDGIIGTNGKDGVDGKDGLTGTVDTTLLTNEIDRAIEAESTKVDKIEGFSLTKNDFTDTLKEKLDSITAIFSTTLKDNYDSAVAWVENNKNNLIAHLSNFNNPHNVTKEQLGLGNVDNTSDLDKITSTATQLVLDTKLDKTSYNEHFKSQYLTEAALKLANPTGVAGDYAQVNEVGSKTVVNYNWDTEANTWVANAVTGSGATTTDTLPEGTKNLYWTVARFLANLTAANIKAALGITTLSGSNTGDQDLSLFTTTDYVNNITAIKAIDEGKGIGYVIANRNPLNYGNVGEGAVDLSISLGTSNTKGATGQNSFACGRQNTASGRNSIASGEDNIASGKNSEASGNYNEATGEGSKSSGTYCKAIGENSLAAGTFSEAIAEDSEANGVFCKSTGKGSIAKGFFVKSLSYIEVVFGSFNTDYIPKSTTIFNLLDRLFVIGNGIETKRSDALIILKNGLATLPSVTIDLISAEPIGKAIVTKEYLEAQYSKNDSALQLVDNTAIPSITSEGMIRYRNTLNGSYVDVVMQTAPSVFEWVNVVENTDIPVVVIVPESPNAYISSGNEVSTNSLIDETISGMSFTPKFPGTYRVDFNANYSVIAGNVCIIATLDLQNLYLDLMNRPATATHGLTFGSGETVTSGIYTVSGAMSVAGTLTLDGGGDPNALFVFRVTGAINTAIATSIVLTNGANAANVFFMAIGAVGIGADNVISGNFIAYGAAAALGANCIFNGRLFSTSGALAFSSGKQTKPIAKSVVDMGILNSFLCFTNQGNVANTALAVITGDLGTGFGNVTTFTNSVFIGDAYDNNQQLGGTSVFSVYKENELVPFSDRTREYSNYLQDVQLMSTVTVLENEAIHIKWRTDVGRVLLKNRILILTKI